MTTESIKQGHNWQHYIGMRMLTESTHLYGLDQQQELKEGKLKKYIKN